LGRGPHESVKSFEEKIVGGGTKKKNSPGD